MGSPPSGMPPLPRTAAQWCGWAQEERRQGRLDRAEAGFRRALAVEPTSLAAMFELASLLLDKGDHDAAGRLTTAMARAAGELPAVLWLQARRAMAGHDSAGARRPLERLLADPRLDGEQRAEALLTLGLALDDLGDPAGAFAAAARGKAIQRAAHAAMAATREGEVAKLTRIGDWIASHPAGWTPPAVEARGAAAGHVFLLGFPRSGTTLLEQGLAAHPAVAALEEEATLASAYQALLANADACADLSRLDASGARAWAEHYWAGIRQRGIPVAGRVFVDKQPAGTVYLPLIARLFPTARILFALRDPRDVVLSCFRQPFAMNAMTYTFTDLGEAAACYAACMTLAEGARAVLPLAWLDVRHEALVDDWSGETARILAFLGLGGAAGALDPVAVAAARPIRTPSARQVRAGLSRRGVGRWRLYERALAPVLPTLAPWVERFGYPR